LDGVEAGRQAAAAPDERLGTQVSQAKDPRARQQEHLLAPPAERTSLRPQRDPVDAPRRASRRRARNLAVPASPARAVDVEVGHHLADAQRNPVGIVRRSDDLSYAPAREMAGD